MLPLEKPLRSKLETTIKEARDIAEAGALAALQQLGIGQAVADAHLTEMEKDLRRRLRAHGRQLGDVRSTNGQQELIRLSEEVAYEHWHRMLFARFLAENNLLMYPDPEEPVAVSLDECEEMASDEGARNGWELAARYAERMLPQIFRPNSPSFELDLPPEYEGKLEKLLGGLSQEVFEASDSLGWVYQFWQAKRKDEINASEVKIGARELPAVTQLFTEPYMVSFLLDNSLGAWWAARRLSEEDLNSANSEEELRQNASLPGVPLEYLRFGRDDESDAWSPASGTFDGWPESLAELKMLDPCCGSGHFLVAAFLMLVPMRMEMESLSAQEAVDAVLCQNLHGLEIDQRCVEIAAFALALAAWSYSETGGFRVLPELQLACCGLSIGADKKEWLALADDNSNLQMVLEDLFSQFKDAPILGSLVNPGVTLGKDSLFELKWHEVKPLLTRAIAVEENSEKIEMGVVALGVSKAASILSDKFGLIVTNVPYLAAGKQSDSLKAFCERHHSEAKSDIATVFVQRLRSLLNKGSTLSLVMPQNWLYQTTYNYFRKALLSETTWGLLAILGEGAFDSPQAAGAFVCNFILSEIPNAENEIGVIDSVSSKRLETKISAIQSNDIVFVSQNSQLDNPDFTFCLETNKDLSSFGKLVDCYQGTSTGDNDRFVRQFHEISTISQLWSRFITPPNGVDAFSGRSSVVNSEIFNSTQKTGAIRGRKAWRNRGVAIGKMRRLPATIYNGELFSNTAPVIIPKDEKLLPAIWAFCSQPDFNEAMRKVNPNVAIENGYVAKLFWDSNLWVEVAKTDYPLGLPMPFSDDPTQWIFHGFPVQSTDPLQVSVARLLGYLWPAELDTAIELSDIARAKVSLSQHLFPYADADGIVCIPAVRGEASASERLLNLLAAAYGNEWNNSVLGQLLSDVGHAGKPLETWLRDQFFAQHCKRFQHRPFIWHIWDGLRDGFAALVNYHKFDAKALETLIYTYLGDWITRQQQDIRNGVDGAQEKLAAAENLKKRLELIQVGEPPYDIFVRWKSIEEQPIGWNSDLNDGVRLNIRPFMTAGVLRENKPPKLNVKWGKDRGKDVESAPWFHLFKGDRINDHHLTRSEKEAARRT